MAGTRPAAKPVFPEPARRAAWSLNHESGRPGPPPRTRVFDQLRERMVLDAVDGLAGMHPETQVEDFPEA